MHEMSLMKDLLKKINGVAREQRARRVTAVKVRLGALCHCSADHFREHFIDGAKGTVAEGARLEMETGTDPHDPHAQDILLLSVDVPQ
ncbi:MAG: hydrogenase nickel incorporation protein HypA [Omnitrophica WOR_2 bacterium GWA2_45_18]|nr:MAG: hydrogenase nickel incorporation protein HypA [Omnitrophica WOR_2 bacterium GWA2_45_18]